MELFKEFVNTYAVTVLYAVLCAVAGFLGSQLKKLYEKRCNDETKRDVAKTVVSAVNQIYRDLHGDEKLSKALESMSQMLEEKGISISELEMRMLIEAAVAEGNAAFGKSSADDEKTDQQM